MQNLPFPKKEEQWDMVQGSCVFFLPQKMPQAVMESMSSGHLRRQFTPSGVIVSGLPSGWRCRNGCFGWDPLVLAGTRQCHCSGQAGTEVLEGRQSCCCADLLIVPLESPILWDGWKWDHMIKTSLIQCSPAAGGLCAACLKQLIALLKMGGCCDSLQLKIAASLCRVKDGLGTSV